MNNFRLDKSICNETLGLYSSERIRTSAKNTKLTAKITELTAQMMDLCVKNDIFFGIQLNLEIFHRILPFSIRKTIFRFNFTNLFISNFAFFLRFIQISSQPLFLFPKLGCCLATSSCLANFCSSIV